MSVATVTANRWLGFCLVLAAALLVPTTLALLWPTAPLVTPSWDIANGLGFVAMALMLLLFFYAGRPRAKPAFGGGFFLHLHRYLGYLALVLALCHAVLLLWIEPLLWEHIGPLGPAYMLAGLAALALLLFLLLAAVGAVRRRLWSDYQHFRGTHALLAITAIALLGWHVLGSQYYLNAWWKLILLALLTMSLLLLYMRGRGGKVTISPNRDRLAKQSVAVLCVLAVLAATSVLLALFALRYWQ